MRPLLYVLFLFCGSLAAQRVTGTIVDVDNDPVPYATIQVGRLVGTMSNIEGKFSINTAQLKPTDLVQITYIGYKPIEITVADLLEKDIFILEKDVLSLNEVLVTNKKFTAEELIAKVLENADSNYRDITYQRKAFIRHSDEFLPSRLELDLKKSSLVSKKELKEINKEFLEKEKRIKGKSSKSFTENLVDYARHEDSIVARVIKSTILINKRDDLSTDKLAEDAQELVLRHLEPGRTYKLKSGLFTIDDSLEVNVDERKKKTYKDSVSSWSMGSNIKELIRSSNVKSFQKDFLRELKRYDYVLEDAVSYHGKTVYVLSFSPGRRSADYVGKLYINADDFAIVKMDYRIADNRDGEGINLKLLLGVKMRVKDAATSVTFTQTDQGNYLPQLIKQSSTSYIYINRPFKIKLNRIDKDEEKKQMKFKILVEALSTEETEVMFMDYAALDKDEFDSIEIKPRYPIEYLDRYDSSLWEDYNILPAIKELEEYKTE
ncbi:MAG: carboxypeptidase-like regulatory domain-containing protein [Nonlabens sp.]